MQQRTWTRYRLEDGMTSPTVTEGRGVHPRRTRLAGSNHSRPAIVLGSKIAAVRIVSAEEPAGKLGYVVQLQPGSQIVLCGPGFNEKTLTVSLEDDLYYVFRFDICDWKQEHQILSREYLQSKDHSWNLHQPDTR